MPLNGLLLSNLGSPRDPSTGAVQAYLRQFLTDGRVIDIPWLWRQLLVRGVIAPLRAPRSARAYAKVWTPEGSPLLVHTRALAAGVRETLGADWRVAPGMRYGDPSLEAGLRELVQAGCERIVVLPLYPQFAEATTGSTVARLRQVLGKESAASRLELVPPFYDSPGFIESVACGIRPLLGPDSHLLLSYHGLPERQILKANPSGGCLRGNCCDDPSRARGGCYKAQCRATSKALAAHLGLAEDRWTESFQSRLGRIPWIGPSTEETARRLAREGVKHLVVATPSFVADCLETLEEIGMGLGETFREAGGATFRVAPCPNAGEAWVQEVSRMAAFLSYPQL
ncbi:MAG TPA: ferrochelatase [Fibrobacteria bacterium]|nr:ferrochelatase [Fibrobacteria bacterium]